MKSPFELRTELIEMAKNHLENQYHANLEFATKAMLQLYKDGMATTEQLSKATPVFPTAEDILEKAKEFYQFVNFGK